MFKKFALAGAMALAVTLVALAANAPTYKDPAGTNRDAVGTICVNPDGSFCTLGSGTGAGLSESDFDSKTGSLTETAPATDVASSGLNGRLQRVAQRVTSMIALLPSSLGQKAKSASLPVTLASDEDILARQGSLTETAPTIDTASSGLNGRLQRIAQRLTSHIGIAQLPSYIVTAAGYTAYATPTDLICISGSATKTVAVTQLYLGIQSTSAAMQSIYFVKRSTANSGGTSTTPTPITYDSSRSAATAVVTVYTAAPTTGNAVGNVRVMLSLSTVLTAAPNVFSLSAQGIPTATRSTPQTPIILRGTAESLCANYNGAALTSGFTATYGVEWVEFTSADD